MKGSVKIAYWDTEQGGQPPSEFGQIKGTPTIKFVTPHKKNKKGKFTKKLVRDYNGEREMKPLVQYAESSMDSFIERINGASALEKFHTKALEYGLPRALVFAKTDSHVVKYMSVEFRRRLLIGEVKATKNNNDIIKQYGIKDFPKVVVLQDDGTPILMEKKPSFNKLNLFFSKHALKKPVFGKVSERAANEEKEKEEL